MIKFQPIQDKNRSPTHLVGSSWWGSRCFCEHEDQHRWWAHPARPSWSHQQRPRPRRDVAACRRTGWWPPRPSHATGPHRAAVCEQAQNKWKNCWCKHSMVRSTSHSKVLMQTQYSQTHFTQQSENVFMLRGTSKVLIITVHFLFFFLLLLLLPGTTLWGFYWYSTHPSINNTFTHWFIPLCMTQCIILLKWGVGGGADYKLTMNVKMEAAALLFFPFQECEVFLLPLPLSSCSYYSLGCMNVIWLKRPFTCLRHEQSHMHTSRS